MTFAFCNFILAAAICIKAMRRPGMEENVSLNPTGVAADPSAPINMVQLEYLNQALPDSSMTYYDPVMQDEDSGSYYTDGSAFGEPNFEDFYTGSLDVPCESSSSQGSLSYLMPMANLNFEESYSPSFDVSNTNLIGSNHCGGSSRSLQRAQTCPTTSPSTDMLYNIQQGIDASMTGSDDNDYNDASSYEYVTEKGRNLWFLALEPGEKRKLVRELQLRWGYANDKRGYGLAMCHAREYIYEEQGMPFLTEGTNEAVKKAIADATVPQNLDKREVRKRRLVQVLQHQHRFSVNTARKYVKEAFEHPNIMRLSDAKLIDIFNARMQHTLSREGRSRSRKAGRDRD